jgi:hypothetical protein
MRKLYVLFAFLCVNLVVNAQIIKYVDNEYQSQVNIYFVDWKYQADAIIYITPYKSYAKKEKGVWYLSKDYKGIKVWVTKKRYKADILIYLSDWKHEVKYNNKYLNYF